MESVGIARALTYNKLGALQGWGLNWKKADPIIRKIIHPKQLGIPSKLFEWSVSDCFKAIHAQQEAAKTFIIRKIYQKYSDPEERKKLIKLLKEDPTANNWLHRHFRKQYLRGHTYLQNQVVYQKNGYKATRISRYRIKLEIQGLSRGKRMTLIVKSNRLPVGQIRVIELNGQLEVHTAFEKQDINNSIPAQTLGIDKGYTEGFYLSDNRVVASGLGELLTKKTERINITNKNRNRLDQHASRHPNKKKRENIFNYNLSRIVKNRKLQRDKAQIKGLIRHGLKQVLTVPTLVYAEDLSSPIKSKTESKRIVPQA